MILKTWPFFLRHPFSLRPQKWEVATPLERVFNIDRLGGCLHRVRHLRRGSCAFLTFSTLVCAAAMSLTSRLRQVRLLIERNELTKAFALLDESNRTNPPDVEVVYLRG